MCEASEQKHYIQLYFSVMTNFISLWGFLHIFIIYSMTNNRFKDIILHKPTALDVAFVIEFS